RTRSRIPLPALPFAYPSIHALAARGGESAEQVIFAWAADRAVERPGLRCGGAAHSARLHRPRRWPDQRSVLQRGGQFEVFAEHRFAARLRNFSSGGVIRNTARDGRRPDRNDSYVHGGGQGRPHNPSLREARSPRQRNRQAVDGTFDSGASAVALRIAVTHRNLGEYSRRRALPAPRFPNGENTRRRRLAGVAPACDGLRPIFLLGLSTNL